MQPMKFMRTKSHNWTSFRKWSKMIYLFISKCSESTNCISISLLHQYAPEVNGNVQIRFYSQFLFMWRKYQLVAQCFKYFSGLALPHTLRIALNRIPFFFFIFIWQQQQLRRPRGEQKQWIIIIINHRIWFVFCVHISLVSPSAKRMWIHPYVTLSPDAKQTGGNRTANKPKTQRKLLEVSNTSSD